MDIEKKANLIKEAIDAIDVCEKKITKLEETNSDLWEKISKTDETVDVLSSARLHENCVSCIKLH